LSIPASQFLPHFFGKVKGFGTVNILVTMNATPLLGYALHFYSQGIVCQPQSNNNNKNNKTTTTTKTTTTITTTTTTTTSTTATTTIAPTTKTTF